MSYYNARRCSDCIHEGCCEGLPYCGGLSWKSAYGECAQCGATIHLDEMEWQTEDGVHCFCSERCMEEWEAENAEEDDAEDE